MKIFSRGITAEATDAVLLSKRARGYEALENWDAAAADWSRAATGNPEAAKLLGEFGQRLAAAGQVPLASGQFEKSQALYERLLEADPENDVAAAELAQLLLDKYDNASSTRWTVLKPTEVKSASGATLTLRADGSVLASGVSPDTDTYTLTADSPLESVSGLRLEALPDASLPDGGPGRGRTSARNGNFHLGDLRVLVDRGERNHAPAAVNLRNAAADYSQYRFPVSNAIDDDPYSAWAIGQQQGKAHSAVFELGTPLEHVQNARFLISLHFADAAWKQHTLGRFRLSASGDPAAFVREQQRFEAADVTDPWLKLAAAYAVHGRNDEALRYFGSMLKRADGYEARMPILELAARFDDVLFALPGRQPGDLQVQLAVARKLAERCQSVWPRSSLRSQWPTSRNPARFSRGCAQNTRIRGPSWHQRN